MADDYRQILGVSTTASLEEIKEAYRHQAKLHHPDKDSSPGAEEKFKKISKAYKILSELVQHEEPKPEEKSYRTRRGSDLIVVFHVGIEDLITCASKIVAVKRTGLCKACEGTGSTEKKVKQCVYCGGSGIQGMSKILGQKKSCLYCGGIGRNPVPPRCSRCNGKGLFPETLQHRIDLNPFSEVVVIRGQGNYCTGGEAGSLIVELEMDKHPVYTLSGLDIMGPLQLSPVQAILGDAIDISVLGKNLRLQVPPGIQNGQVIERENGGVTYKGKTGWFKGRVRITVPQVITQEEEGLYRKILALEKETAWPKALMF